MRFSTQTMHEIYHTLKEILNTSQSLSFETLDPDLYDGYAGTEIKVQGQSYLYRSYKSWNELAELLECKMLTPLKTDDHLVKLTFRKLDDASFHQQSIIEKKEKYGKNSTFWKINKLEEPAFLHYYLQALENVNISQRKRILDLGVHRGDELQAIKDTLDPKAYECLEFVGIDHSQTAIAHAKEKFPLKNATFYCADINTLEALEPGRFDLLISIGTLQSPGINYKPLLMNLVQHYLEKKDSALILGFPNCRWIGGEMCYGAKAPNYAMSEMSLLWNDVIFAKKYLQQHKYRVTITGKEYIFLTATKITSSVKEN